MNKRRIGAKYEQIAADFLVRMGYTILDRNFQARNGEIDIIAADGGEIHFVEVKYRKNLNFGYPSEAVDYRKRQSIIAASNYYLYMRRMPQAPRSYDVVEIVGNQIRLLKNCFGG